MIEKLLSSLPDRQQDLAELGITEYVIQSIASKLSIITRHTEKGPVTVNKLTQQNLLTSRPDSYTVLMVSLSEKRSYPCEVSGAVHEFHQASHKSFTAHPAKFS